MVRNNQQSSHCSAGSVNSLFVAGTRGRDIDTRGVLKKDNKTLAALRAVIQKNMLYLICQGLVQTVSLVQKDLIEFAKEWPLATLSSFFSQGYRLPTAVSPSIMYTRWMVSAYPYVGLNANYRWCLPNHFLECKLVSSVAEALSIITRFK